MWEPSCPGLSVLTRHGLRTGGTWGLSAVKSSERLEAGNMPDGAAFRTCRPSGWTFSPELRMTSRGRRAAPGRCSPGASGPGNYRIQSFQQDIEITPPCRSFTASPLSAFWPPPAPGSQPENSRPSAARRRRRLRKPRLPSRLPAAHAAAAAHRGRGRTGLHRPRPDDPAVGHDRGRQARGAGRAGRRGDQRR